MEKKIEDFKLKNNNDIFQLLNKFRLAVMGVAALWILFFHTWRMVFINHPFIYEIEKFIKIIGFCGVDIFFFLSGIGLTFSIKNSSLKDFYFKRVKRIIVPFLITAIVVRNF